MMSISPQRRAGGLNVARKQPERRAGGPAVRIQMHSSYRPSVRSQTLADLMRADV